MRPFLDIIRELERGQLLNDLTDEQARIVAGVRETHGTGELTIKITYKLISPGQMEINATINAKPPKVGRQRSIFFLTPEGELVRDHPDQYALRLAAEKAADSEQHQNPGRVSP